MESIKLVSSVNEVMFQRLSVCSLDCFVCKQDYGKTAKRISTKIGERMWYWSGKKSSIFSANLDQGGDFYFKLSLKF